ncbi:MAG: hypothetical protein WCD76_03170 [Pyrinomonadaceae bacterium]
MQHIAIAMSHNGIVISHNAIAMEHNGIAMEHNGIVMSHNGMLTPAYDVAWHGRNVVVGAYGVATHHTGVASGRSIDVVTRFATARTFMFAHLEFIIHH